MARLARESRRALAALIPRTRAGSERSVWAFTALVAAAGVLLWTGPVAGFAAIAQPVAPWWLLAALVAVAERWPVKLEFRRSAHSFSLTDVPFTLALIFAGGSSACAAVVAGSAVALVLRRLPLVKVAFNLAQFLFCACLSVLALRAVAGADPEFGPRVWLGALVATQLGGIVTIALLAAVIRLADGAIGLTQLRQMFSMDAVVTATNSSLALLLAMIVVHEPAGMPVVLVPVAVAAIGYRVYVSERLRHEKLEFLYEANRTLAQSPEVALALRGLLERALEAFRAERAEVILFNSEGAPPLRTSLVPGGGDGTMEPVDAGVAGALRDAALAAGGRVRVGEPFEGPCGEYLRGRGVRHAMVAALQGEERVIGVMLLADRLGITRGFTDDDLALFDTLAANATAALQYDRLERAVSDLRGLQEQLHHQAYHDPLTGLANRALFGQSVHAALADGKAAVAVLFIDLDDFKTVNDTMGHAVGDELLLAAAGRLRGCVREADVVARLGGDEFAVLLRRGDDVEACAVEVAERILTAFAPVVKAGEHVLPVHLSVGIASSLHSGRRTEDLLRDADVAMYEAKESGKGRYALFSPGMREAILRRHSLKGLLEQAVEHDEFVVQYQPIFDLTTGAMATMEALVRWEHPGRGRIPPGEFIPLAEETGLIVPIGRLVLERACRQARVWTEEWGRPVTVQVNLSAIELEAPDLLATVTAAIAAGGIAPEQLTLEVTETLLVRDAITGAAKLAQLRELGVRLALDDFGTGYSSLSYLRTLPLDSLKIAKPFVDGLLASDYDEAFVRLIIELARTVGLAVVAEGIESAEQAHRLRELGCDLGQGFLFARPLDAGDAWFARARVAAAAAT